MVRPMAQTAPLEQPRESVAAAAEPDLRLLQANERTLLAWVRTSIALLGFGFAIAKFGAVNLGARPDRSLWLAAGFLGAGIVSNVFAAVRYFAVRRSLETGQPLPRDHCWISVYVALVSLLGVALGAWLLVTSR